LNGRAAGPAAWSFMVAHWTRQLVRSEPFRAAHHALQVPLDEGRDLDGDEVAEIARQPLQETHGLE